MAALITGVQAVTSAGIVTATGEFYNIPDNNIIPTLNVKEMLLSNNTYYSYTDTLDKIAYNFTFRYSTRESCWYMDIASNDNVPIIVSTKLIVNYPMLDDFTIDELTGWFWLSPILPENINKLTEDPKSIADYFTLLYFYEV